MAFSMPAYHCRSLLATTSGDSMKVRWVRRKSSTKVGSTLFSTSTSCCISLSDVPCNHQTYTQLAITTIKMYNELGICQLIYQDDSLTWCILEKAPHTHTHFQRVLWTNLLHPRRHITAGWISTSIARPDSTHLSSLLFIRLFPTMHILQSLNHSASYTIRTCLKIYQI